MVKRFVKGTEKLIVSGVILSTGSVVVGRVGAPPVVTANIQSGIQNVSSAAPVIGTGLGAGAALRSLRLLQSRGGDNMVFKKKKGRKSKRR